MRATDRVPVPDLDDLLCEVNSLLEAARLPLCNTLRPVDDGDTMNPNVYGFADGHRRYVIKSVVEQSVRGEPFTLQEYCEVANWFRNERGLPVPAHLAQSPLLTPWTLASHGLVAMRRG